MGFIKRIKIALKPLKGLKYGKNIEFGSYEFSIGQGSVVDADLSSKILFEGVVTLELYVIMRANDNALIKIGKDVFIGDYSTIRATRHATVEIGDNTMISQGVKIISTNHAYSDKSRLIKEQDIIEDKKGIKIGNDCWLGTGCVVLPGVILGNGVVIGANSVVTKNIPDFAIAVGNPAKILKYRT